MLSQSKSYYGKGMTHIRLAQFEGPYDLLLSLVDERKLSVSELALCEVTEQFLQYLDTLEEKQPNEVADFLVVAARLLYLKSSALLPQFGTPEDEGDAEQLASQLRLYKAFVETSRHVLKHWTAMRVGFFRIESPRRSTSFAPGTTLTASGLAASMLQLANRLAPPKPIPRAEVDRRVTLRATIDRIREFLASHRSLSFRDLVPDRSNPTQTIISCIALLELAKQHTIHMTQEELFGDITIVRT